MAKKSEKGMDAKKGNKKTPGIVSRVVNKLTGQDKKKRGQYKRQECPYCHKMVGNLGNHIALKHPLEEPPAELTKETLLTRKKPPAREKVIYACTNCRAEVRKDEATCWRCGATLKWEGIE